jgi:hypothetical protein
MEAFSHTGPKIFHRSPENTGKTISLFTYFEIPYTTIKPEGTVP